MRYRRAALVAGLLCVLLSASAVTLTAFNNFRDSHAALGEFDVILEEVERVDELRNYKVTISLVNGADEIPTEVEFLGLRVYSEDLLVLAEEWFPDEFVVPPGEEIEKTFELNADLREETLRGLSDEEDNWWSNIRLRISHPITKGTFVVDMDRNISE